LTAKEIVELAYKAKDFMVFCMLSEPGQGKTQAVYEFAEENGLDVVLINCSQILPTEISGLIMPDQETRSMEVFDHARLASLKDGDILFFDELLQAPPAVLQACLTLIEERTLLSGKKLPNVLVIAAANEISKAKIESSIKDRFHFIEVRFNSDKWIRYIKGRYPYCRESALRTLVDELSICPNVEWNALTPRSTEKYIELLAINGGNSNVLDKIDVPKAHLFNSLFIRNKFAHVLPDEYKFYTNKQLLEEIKTNERLRALLSTINIEDIVEEPSGTTVGEPV
jgi:hypothetical protein